MGVYHLMGLGRSVGTVIGPLTYLAHRYNRWNADDRRFFDRSGEVRQRQAGERVGDIQALVLFTTREVLNGTALPYKYADNLPGQIPPGAENVRGVLEKPMKEVLRTLLCREWPAISGEREKGTIFWCEVDRRNIRVTYERVVRVVAALAGVGGQGKEMWVNLTGGNNVINFALELAAMLSGNVARLYYVQAENEDAEKCVRYTAEDGYWVDLPVMPLALGRLRQTIIQILNDHGSTSEEKLYSRLKNEYYDLSRGLTSEETLRNEYLTPMRKQGLIAKDKDGYIVGPQWELIRPYQELLQEARAAGLTIEDLARQEPWRNWLEEERVALGR
jgi:hypothetical protein